jgi:hypothetical protein
MLPDGQAFDQRKKHKRKGLFLYRLAVTVTVRHLDAASAA